MSADAPRTTIETHEPRLEPARAVAEAPAAFAAAPYAMWLVAPMAFVCIFAKIHKLVATPGGDLASGLAALFPDLLFIAGFSLVTWAALAVSRGPIRGATRIVLHLVTFTVTLLLFVEHGFWITTGTLLDSYTLGYGLEHIGSLGKVYLSEMGFGVWLGLALLLAAHYLPLAALRRSRAIVVPRPALLALAILPAATAVSALAVDVSPAMAPLSDNVVVTLAGDALAPRVEAQAPSDEVVPDDELVLGLGPPVVADPPRNVIIIIMESLRARSTTVHDPSLDTTPFLASLAERGATVETAWTAVTHTSKAIVGILCGIYPRLDLPIDEAEPTGLPPTCLARILRQRGYATAFMQTATAHFERRDQLVRNMRYETFLSKETIPLGDFEETSYFGWEDEALVAPAVDWARARTEAGEPFFLTLLTLSTHHTYKTPTRFEKKKRTRGELDQYLNAVSYLDATLATLFEQLEAAGALDGTLVVLVGDHGEGFGEHGRRQHDAVIYEEGLHVPLLLLGPGVEPGARLTGLRHVVDIAPTVLEWLGTPVESGLPGVSLLSTKGHPHLFGSCWLRKRCMATREAGLKLIWHFDRRPPELFDLAADPLERENLLDSTAEAVWRPMKERLLAWYADNHARWARFFSEAAKDFVTTLPPLPEHERDVRFVQPATEAQPARPIARLVGYDIEQSRVVSGDPIRITLAWEALSPPGSWRPFAHLLGKSQGTRKRYNADHTPVNGRHPTSAWVPGTFVSDAFRIQPKDPLPPGTYELVLGFWNPDATGGRVAGRAEIEVGPTGSEPPTVDDDRRLHLLEVQITPPPITASPD